ncbi:MAG TPA: HAMP domain-containing sensor histidine kinase [Candidatus Nitrosotalea sp.]|nr:HAMP domain-containing sensor histidine kinase [Candidatus Nitrosotalea sp.]
MKLTQKTYLLLGIIIGVSAVNLYLLLSITQENLDVLHSISDANDLKVIVEKISGTANSIASGNETDRQTLVDETNEFDNTYAVLGSGGVFQGTAVVPVPPELHLIYDKVGSSWQTYKNDTEKVRQESVFDPKVKNALSYILGKNGDLISYTNQVVNDLAPLDRNFNKHKMIAAQMVNIAKDIGQNTLLISIGEGKNVTGAIKKDRLTYDADLKNLEGVPLDDPGYAKYGLSQDNLLQIPRANSDSLRTIDPLWEAEKAKLEFVENNTLISKEFGSALQNLDSQRTILLGVTSQFVDDWNNFIDSKLRQNVVIVQGLLIADSGVFAAVLFSIRKSLAPLKMLTNAIVRVREGIFGEPIGYVSNDEVGELATTINSLSSTIQKKEEDARKVEIAKDEFLAMITHELKTPLVPIQGYSDILLGEHLGTLNKNQKERIEVIRSSAASLLQLISDLLDAQKLELGQLRIKKASHNLRKTIENTIVVMQPQAMAEKITVTQNLDRDIYAEYDEERIVQVLTNLIKNSLKATPPKTGKIEILVEEKPEEIVVSVKDNGKGIPHDAIDKVFKKFYQVDTSSTRESGGSGLGLSICKGIVDAHGGRIWVTSELSKGAVFSFTLQKNASSKTPV